MSDQRKLIQDERFAGISESLMEKYQNLCEDLRAMGSAVIAFSGGVDSTFLLKTAQEVLGEQAVALTITSDFIPERELGESIEFCEEQKIRHRLIPVQVLEIEGVKENPANRCYLCKRSIFQLLQQAAAEYGTTHVLEGSNMDDNGDYRPGMQAIAELGIESPLRKAGLWKAEIRELSHRMNLPTWKKPSFACLASRIPYSEEITTEKLRMVELAEEFLIGKGFEQERVRISGKTARIEVLPEDIIRIAQEDLRTELVARFREIGFRYVSLDLKGYRTGSLNEVLKK